MSAVCYNSVKKFKHTQLADEVIEMSDNLPINMNGQETGAISYANEVKEGLLGVDGTALATEGAVSEPVVRQMSEGVSRALNTDCAVATSGIAGPGGGTADKPVGTVWISATKRGQTESKCYHFAGNRDRVINHATTMAQIMLIKMLIN